MPSASMPQRHLRPGLLLYTFLAGKPPFQGATMLELIEAKEKEKHTPARRLNDEVPDRLDLIIDKMIAKEAGAPPPEARRGHRRPGRAGAGQ